MVDTLTLATAIVSTIGIAVLTLIACIACIICIYYLCKADTDNGDHDQEIVGKNSGKCSSSSSSCDNRVVDPSSTILDVQVHEYVGTNTRKLSSTSSNSSSANIVCSVTPESPPSCEAGECTRDVGKGGDKD